MSTPYLGEIRLVGFNFPPNGWAFCDGALMSISQNLALFDLLGTTYGGDGAINFALPDLRGRAIVHAGQGSGLLNYVQGQTGGVETVTLIVPQMPAHTHSLMVSSNAGTSSTPQNSCLALSPANLGSVYGTTATGGRLLPQAIRLYGSNQAHDNLMPYLAMNYIIALQGIFPSQN